MRRLLLGIALCAAIAGCSKAEDGLETQVGAYSLFDPAAVNPSLCGGGAVPFPNNAFFAAATATGVTTDTTLNIPSTASTAVAANLTDGFSTTASAFTDVLGLIDFSSAANSIFILEAGAAGNRMLVAGVDYTLQPSIAMGQLSGTGGCALSASVNTGRATFLPISQQRTRILIEPLKPLKPSTNYIVVVTRDLLSADGLPTVTNEFFPIVNSNTAICDRNNTNPDATILDCTDPLAPADAAARLNAPALTTMTAPYPDPLGGAPLSGAAAAAARLTTLEALRAGLVRPTVLGFQSLAPAAGGPTIADADIVIAWSFTTQSISASLATLNAIQTAKTFTVADSGIDTVDLGLADTADIWVGRLDAVPYYLDDASGPNDAASQLGFWLNNGTVTGIGSGGFVPWTPLADYGTGAGVTPAPCTLGGATPFNWVAPVSTTNCHRIPTTRSTEDLPVIITVPKTAKPGSGWPVAIFQHGITGNRTQMLAIGPTLASAGFVTIAIDLPLHGVLGPLGPTNPFYQDGFERHFELDVATNPSGSCLSAPGGDGQTDPSGTCFINLASLITSRDNLRQAAADLIHLAKSLGDAGLDFDGGGNDIDTSQIHFVGISLGSIVGTTMLGVNTDVQAASLSVPGGGLGKLLDASVTFGPVVAGGLAGVAFSTNLNGVSSPFEGTDTYETFVRFAQHLVDPGDPINYAVAANANHPIHMTEVIGDTVVPNSALTTCPAADQLAPGIGGTPATDNTNAETREAACEAGAALVGADASVLAIPDCAAATATGVCAGSASQDEVLHSGFLSGTEPLFGEMGLDVTGPITPPTDCATDSDVAELDVVVQFAVGSHGSLLSPAASAAATAEMQRQTTSYLLSGGTDLDLLGSCP
ncbi:MAG: hypothetical protein ACRES8_02420 [Nevskiaceae bacterium]